MYSLGCPSVPAPPIFPSSSACVGLHCCRLNFLTGGTSAFKEDFRFNACSGNAGIFSFKFALDRSLYSERATGDEGTSM